MADRLDIGQMLERVLLKFSAAEEDGEFEVALKKYLPAVLLQLKTFDENVRKKVLEMLVHINKRLKTRPNIQLPLDALLPIYADMSDPEASSLVHNFCIIYLKMGMERLDLQSRARMAPRLLRIIEDKPQQHQEGIILLLLPLLGSIPFEATQSSQDRKATLGLEHRPETKKLLLEMMFDLLLLPNGNSSTSGSSSNSDACVPAAGGATPPGMSRVSLQRINGENPMSPEQMEIAKLSVLRFIDFGIFDDDEIVLHLVVASSDKHLAVAAAAETVLQRCATVKDWNRPSTVVRMFDIFLGDAVAKKQSATIFTEEEKRSAASTRLRLKLFPFLLKSRQSAEYFPALVQVVFDCLFGSPSSNAELKTNAVRLVLHACELCGNKIFQLSGATMMPAMTRVVREMEDQEELCSLALVAIGKIGRRLPNLVRDDIAFLQTNFEALTMATGPKLSALQEMLSTLAPCFVSLGEPQRSQLEAVVMQYGERPETPSRLIALKYASVCFPRNHMPSRYVILLCAGDAREEVRSEALKLRQAPDKPVMAPKTKAGDHKGRKIVKLEERQFPNFGVAADYVYQRGKFSDQRREAGSNNDTRVQIFNPPMMVEVVAFLRACLAAEAGCPLEGKRPHLNVAQMKYQAPTVTKYLGRAMKDDPSSLSPVRRYKYVVESLLQQQGSAESLYLMTELVAADGILAREVADTRLDWIRDKFLFSPKEDVREAASQLYAVLVAIESESDFIAQIRSLLVCLGSETTNLERLSGSILGLGAAIGRRSLTFETWQNCPSKEIAKFVNEAVSQLSMKLQHPSSLVQISSVAALTEMARFAQLPLPDGELPIENEESQDMFSTKSGLATLFLDFVSSSKHPSKLRENAAVAAAALCCGTRSWCRSRSGRFPYGQEIMKRLMESYKIKDFELHIHVGAALTTAALGTGSRLASDSWTADEEVLEENAYNAPTENLEFLVDKLTKVYLKSDNKHLKQAAAVWTICMMQEAGHLPFLQRQLSDVQDSIVRLLFVDDEITQELASKTLGICYSCSSEESREYLISNLCESLIGSEDLKTSDSGSEISVSKSSFSRSKSTKFFGAGSKALAYRELAALAIELKQPELVYKLIYLSHSNANLKTPGLAASFAGRRRHAEIASEARRQLAPHMGTMVPKLFRYLHDPDVKIQAAMSSIWQALVPTESKAVIDAHLEGVLEELLWEIEDRGSEIRESCCAALTEALRGRALNPIVVERLGRIWKVILARLDDVKESVRKAATEAAKMVIQVTILACDTNNGNLGALAITDTLPVLLEDGVYNTKDSDVRSLVLDTMQKLSRQTGIMLTPHLARLIPALLEAVGDLESSSLNHLSLCVARTDRLDVQQKMIDGRVAESNNSPIMETLKYCIQFIDDEVMATLAPTLVEILKNGIGTAIRVATSELVVAFVFQIPTVVEPHSPKFMSPLLGGLSDRQSGIRRAFSTAIGYLAKVSPDKTVDKALDKLKAWYLEKPVEERDLRRACESAMSAISKNAPEKLKEHAKHAMPLAFIAMHERDDDDVTDDGAAAGWLKIWTDVTPGMEMGIHLYLREIVHIISSTLSIESCSIRAQAGRAASTVAQCLPHEKMEPKMLKRLLDSVTVVGLSGRTWDGKEALLEATQNICCHYKRFFSREESDMEIDGDNQNDPLLAMRSSLLSTLLREARKDHLFYKRVAVDCASRVIETWGEYEKFPDLAEVVITRLKKRGEGDGDEDMEHDGNKRSISRLEFEESALESLGRAFPVNKPPQREENLAARDAINALALRSSDLHSWKVRLSALKGLAMVAEKHWHLRESTESVRRDELNALVKPMIKAAMQNMTNKKYVVLRKVSVEILEKILKSPNGLVKAREALEQAVQPLVALQSDAHVELQKKSEELLKLLS